MTRAVIGNNWDCPSKPCWGLFRTQKNTREGLGQEGISSQQCCHKPSTVITNPWHSAGRRMLGCSFGFLKPQRLSAFVSGLPCYPTIPSDTWICLHFCLHGGGCWEASCFRGTCGLWMRLFTLMWQKGGTRPEIACCAVYCLIYLWPCLSHRCQYVLSSFTVAQNVSPGLTHGPRADREVP